MIENLTRFVAEPAVSAVLIAIAGAVVGLWLAAAWWAYSDAGRRTESEAVRLLAAGWVVLSGPLLIPLSLGIYVAVRPQVTVGEKRSRSLVAALAPVVAEELRCGACRAATDPDWRRCPTCTEWLQAPCAHCGAWSDLELDHCPWCGSETLDIPRVTSLPAPEPAPARAALASPGLLAFVGGNDGLDPAFGGAAGAGPIEPVDEATAVHDAHPVDTSAGTERDAQPSTAAGRAARALGRWRDAGHKETPGAQRARRSGAREAGGRPVSRTGW